MLSCSDCFRFWSTSLSPSHLNPTPIAQVPPPNRPNPLPPPPPSINSHRPYPYTNRNNPPNPNPKPLQLNKIHPKQPRHETQRQKHARQHCQLGNLRRELDLLARLSERGSASQHRDGILMVLCSFFEARREEGEVRFDSGLGLVCNPGLCECEIARPLYCMCRLQVAKDFFVATCVVGQEVFVRDELVEDLVGGGGGEAEDGGEGVEGVEGGDGVVEEQVEFAGEVGCGLDQGVGGDDVGVDGARGEGGEGVLEFRVDAEERAGDEDDPSGAGFGAGFEWEQHIAQRRVLISIDGCVS
ncbi:hypothetical protein HBI54_074260 [Parastagonospora nodorum]|nr:hypothetical protein HBI54_074260 [Parastagonospora nodorum]